MGKRLDNYLMAGDKLIIKYKPKKLHELNAEKMQIFVKMCDNRTLVFDVLKEGHRVSDLKLMLFCRSGAPPNDQRILYSTFQLEDGRVLNDYGIQKESTLNLMYRARGS